MTEGSAAWLLDALARVTVASIELIRVSLPLRRPHRAAHGTTTERESVLVRAELDDGSVGWGECPALAGYGSETAEGAWLDLTQHLAPRRLGGEPPDDRAPPMARFALEGALVDALARSQDINLASAYGASTRMVECTAVVSAASTAELVRLVADRLDEGYRSVSVKIWPGWDAEPLQALRSSWPQLTIAADANGSYPHPDDLPGSLDRLGLAHLEQPLPPGELAGLSDLQRRGIVIALDESLCSVADLDAALAAGLRPVLNLKPARLGSLGTMLALEARARAEGLDAFCGGMLETGIGRAQALAFAALQGCNLPTHLGPSRNYFEHDLTPAFELQPGARLEVPGGAGIGVVPLPEQLARATVASVRLDR